MVKGCLGKCFLVFIHGGNQRLQQPWSKGSLALSLIDRKIWHHLCGDGFADFKSAREVGLWIIALKNQRKLVNTGNV